MSTVRLNPLDTAWVLTETRAAPNHIGGLLQFRLPAGAPRDFLRRLMAEFRGYREFKPPWNRRLKYDIQFNPFPVWIEDEDIDLEYHVRHAALPWPGGERELGELVGRLQSTPLDLSRPPWECTIIEGLDENRFAVFIKMHHSLIDGVSGMKLLQRSMSSDRRKSLGMPPFWASGAAPAHPAEAAAPAPTFASAAAVAVEALRCQVRTLPQLVAAFAKLVTRTGDRGEGKVVPFESPLSVLNGRVREKRRFATQQFAMERLRTLAKAADCTVNDVVVAICSGALRRFLLERDSLPATSLTAGIPVSVRPIDDEGMGNAITWVVATLGTDIADPAARLAAIKASVHHAKDHVQGLPRAAMQQYTMLLMAPTILTMLTGIGGRVRPMFNVTVSNVHGPDEPLYFRGAELLAIYPASIVTHGQALNITCQSYTGWMDFGFTGCHSSVPSLQRLAVYSADALRELEAAKLPRARAGRAQGHTAARLPAPGSERAQAATTKGSAAKAPALRGRAAKAKAAKLPAAGSGRAAGAARRTAEPAHAGAPVVARPRARKAA